MMNKQKYYISVVYHNVMRGLAIYCGLILGIIVILKLAGDRYGIVSILVLLEYVMPIIAEKLCFEKKFLT